MNSNGILRTVAKLAPWLAPLPSAWFVGRSIYLHLLLDWAPWVNIPVWVNVLVALVAGLTVETLAMVSVHNSLALHRWNDYGHVRKEAGWEKAPFWLAAVCAGLYVVSAVILLFVLETQPQAANWAPLIFPAMTIVAAVNLGVLDQHLSRLKRYGMTWDLVKIKEPKAEQKPEDVEQEPEGVGQPEQVAELDAIDEALLHAWLERSDLTQEQAGQVAGVSKSTVNRRATKLESVGLIEKTRDGVAVLWSDNGRDS